MNIDPIMRGYLQSPHLLADFSRGGHPRRFCGSRRDLIRFGPSGDPFGVAAFTQATWRDGGECGPDIATLCLTTGQRPVKWCPNHPCEASLQVLTITVVGSRLKHSSCFLMLHVRALSGDPVAELHVEELEATHQEGSLVLALKKILAAKLGCSRFRMKLLQEDRQEIHDDAPLTGPADILLVRMDFQLSNVATDTAFLSACEGGHVTEVDCLLHALPNPDAREGQNNCTGIHLAAMNGHSDVVRLLLEAGADKDAAMQHGTTALHPAAANGHSDVARLLLEAGADNDAAMQHGTTALHKAALHGHLDVVRLLLEARADKDAVMQDGTTALHVAGS